MNSLSDALLTFRGIQKYRNFLRYSDYYPAQEIKQIQSAWLNLLLTHAHDNIPWYSERFRLFNVRLNTPDPFHELAKLPILSKAEVRENHADFCIPGASLNSLKFATSGTTGEPLVVYTSPKQWVVEQAAIWRQWKWAGYNFRDRIAIFRSYSPKPSEPLIKIDSLRNWAYFSVFKMDDDSISKYADFLKRWRPRYLRGYPSSLFLIAQHALHYRWKLPTLKGAFVASEAIPPNLRDLLRQAFDIELFDHYGQAEITCMFHDCEMHSGMHVDWEYGHVELLPTDKAGIFKIIATNFHNTAMPLLRYDTGDLAEGYWDQCSCGRTSPIVRKIYGRMDDFLIATDGSKIPTVNLYTYFSKISEVRRFQLIQNQPGALDIYLSLWSDDSDQSLRERLFKMITDFFATTLGFSVQIHSSMQWQQSSEGKFPTFIQRIGK